MPQPPFPCIHQCCKVDHVWVKPETEHTPSMMMFQENELIRVGDSIRPVHQFL